ncbi:hypothetical protein SAMN05444580_108139 [Rhodococcus tukisamuensis]|uniref:Metallo-beta-lactamase superfamily protein n=1 Tax=Rhodococcus tukisamuensis TaxID=168276 RepID=A0A1G6Z8K3_9NOCA|nr:hypothetical protein SAMN05444580_108139 [Rhodococcus tukisamuensis]
MTDNNSSSTAPPGCHAKKLPVAGDSLFPGGLGRTTNPEEFNGLYRDVTTKIFERFPDDTTVYPGHGKDTTLGTERPHLAEWQARGW